MDKTEKKVLDFMLIKTYDEIIFDVISSYVLLDIAEIKNTLKIDQKYVGVFTERLPPSKQAEGLVMIKEHVFQKLMQKDDVKKNLLGLLKPLAKKREELVEEVMKQYGLLNDTEAVYIAQQLCDLFDTNMKRIQRILEKGQYLKLYRAELAGARNGQVVPQ